MFKKKVALAALAVVLILCAVLCFAACNDPSASDGVEKHITVLVGDKTFEVTTDRTYLHGVLCDLEKDGKITAYVYSDGIYGISVVQVDVLTQDPNWMTPPFLSIWHSVDEADIKSVYNEAWASSNPSRSTTTVEDGTTFVTYTHNGVLLYYSGAGVGTLPVYDGATYAVFVD